MRLSLVLALTALAPSLAGAQPPDGAPPDEVPPPPDPGPADPASDRSSAPAPTPDPVATEDPEFGPLLLVERINIIGNTSTQSELIRRALPLQPGDVVRASDGRLRDARFKVLAMGFFRDVTLTMQKGSERHQVVLDVVVEERGTVVLNRLWFGRSSLTPYWLGLDVGERNLFGLGVAVGAGFIYAARGDVDGADDQWATELRAADHSILGTRVGANGSFTLVRGSESYRIAGETGAPTALEQRAFPYRRLGGRGTLTFDATSLTRLAAGLRIEGIHADLPVAPTQTLPDGRVVGIDLHLDPGSSRVVSGSFSIDRDTRPDPILPHAGDHLVVGAELGTVLFGGDYQYATIFGRFEKYRPLAGGDHAIGLKMAGGVVIGDAPRFERIHIADVDRMLTPRALGLVLSTAAPLDILGTRAGKPSYGDLGGSVNVEYAISVFRGAGKKRVYGGDIFIGVGVWGLAENSELRARDASIWDALPIDLYADAGVRIDTDVGIFELTIANALGRLR